LPEVWQGSLQLMAACGVQQPTEVLAANPLLLAIDHTSPAFVQHRLLAQRFLYLPAEAVYSQPALILARIPPQALAHRLQYLENKGLLGRLVPGQPSSLRQLAPQPAAAAAAGTAGATGSSRAWAPALAPPPPQAALPFYGVAHTDGIHFSMALNRAFGTGDAWEGRLYFDDWVSFQTRRPPADCPIWQWVQLEAQQEILRLQALLGQP